MSEAANHAVSTTEWEPGQPPRQLWRVPLSSFVLLGAVLVVLYYDSYASLVLTWARSGTFQHGFLIFPISMYLIWEKRGLLRHQVPSYNAWGAVVLLVLSAMWLLAVLADLRVLEHAAVVFMVPALVLAVFGWRVVRVLLFPLAYLAFAVPAGQSLVGPLQDLTAYFTVAALQWSGIPVFSEGRFISIPNGNFEVAEACSGIRFFIASAALGCLYAYLVYRSWRRRLWFMLAALVVPIIANGVRAFGIILIAHWSDMRWATGTDHVIFGWHLFGAVLFIMFWIGWRWRELDAPAEPRDPASTVTANPLSAGRRTAWTVVCAAILALGPLLSQRVMTLNTAPLGLTALQAPNLAAPWRDRRAADSVWRPEFKGADAELLQAYGRGKTDALLLYAALYGGGGGEVINYDNRLYDPAQWQRLDEQDYVIDGAAGATWRVREVRLRSAAEQRLVWYWYEVDGYRTVAPSVVKLRELWSLLRLRRPRSGVIALSARYTVGEVDQARALLRGWIQLADVDLRRLLRPSPTRLANPAVGVADTAPAVP